MRSPRGLVAGLFAVVLVPASVTAGNNDGELPAPKDIDNPFAIFGGTAAAEGEFRAVAGLRIAGGLCTGTLIDPEWVLTAAHCIDPAVLGASSQQQVTANTTVHFDTVNLFQDPGREIEAVLTIKKQQFNVNSLGQHDIGLIKLATPVTDIEPIPVNFDPAQAPVGLTPILMVGFGQTQSGGVGRMFKVDGRTAISCQNFGGSNQALICYSQTDGKGKCEGDSGGPSFATVGGVRKIVGVTSFGDQNCTQFGADTRTDAEKAFLETNIPDIGGCVNDSECNDGKVCETNACVDPPFVGGGFGVTCDNPMDCDSGECANGPGGTLCTATCSTAAPGACPSGFECLAGEGATSGLCWPSDKIDGGGCCDASGNGAPTMLLGIGLIGLILRRRRR